MLPQAKADTTTIDTAAALLQQGGVALIRMPLCVPGQLALYVPSKRQIQLCPDASGNQQQLLKTIAHEAVHAAQHCTAIRFGPRPFRFTDRLLPTSRMIVYNPDPATHQRYYNFVQQAKSWHEKEIVGSIALTTHNPSPQLFRELVELEAEAYGLANEPKSALQMFLAFCKPIAHIQPPPSSP